MPSINEIIGQEAFDQITRLKGEMKELVSDFEKSSKAAILLEKALAKAEGFRMTVEAMDKLARGQKKVVETTDELIIKTGKLETVYKETGNVINDRQQKELDAALAAKQWAEEEKKLAVELLKNVNTIKQATEANKLLRAQRDAVNVTTAEGKKKIDELNTAINKNTELIRANSDTAKQQSMNVGNYANQFNNLKSSITQVTRELPNFAISAQTGIMSLTNNVGAFQDAVSKIREQNKILAAEGKPTVSVLSQIGSALFSWPTLIMAAVTAVTAYSKEITEWTKNLFRAKDAQVDLNDVVKQGLKDAQSELTHLDRLYSTSTNLALSMEQRLLAGEKIKEQYKEQFKNYSAEEIALGKAKVAYDELRDSIIKTAKIKAAEAKITEIVTEGLDKELELQKKYEDAKKRRLLESGRGITLETGVDEYGKNNIRSTLSPKEADAIRRRAEDEAFIELREYEKTQSKKVKVLTDYIDRMGDVKTEKELEQGQKELDLEKAKNERKLAQDKKALEQKARELQELHDRIQKYLRFDIDNPNAYAQEDIKGWNEYFKKMKEGIDKAIANLFSGAGGDAVTVEIMKEMDSLVAPTLNTQDAANLTKDINNRETPAERKKRQQEELKGIIRQMQQLMELVNTIRGAISDITSGLSERANNIADKEISYIDRVEKAKLDSLGRMTMSETKRAEEQKKIEMEAEARRKKVENERITRLRKYAVIQKAADVAAITTTTALAIMKAWAEGDPYTKGIRAAAAGIAGAAQITRALATPLPEYKDGTEFHKGGKAVMGDGYEHELVQQPDGKVWITDKTPTVYDLPTGSSVLPLGTDILAIAQQMAMQKLALKGGAVTSNSYAEAYVNAFDELSGKMDKLTDVMKEKKLSVSFYGSREYFERINNNW